jgi:hypothetical protein
MYNLPRLPRWKSKHHLLSTALVLMLIAVPIVAISRAAALGQSITASPTSELVTIKPGGTSTGSVQVLNQGSTAYDFRAYVTPYRVASEAYTPIFTPLPGAPNVLSWFHLTKTAGHLAAGSNLELPYRISVPAGTPAGGYYATLFAETEGGNKSGGVILHERVGTIFYITVSGALKQQGQLLSWKSSFIQAPPLTASLRIENSGNVHFPVTLHANVKDIFGKTKYTQYTVKEVLPQSIRAIPVVWSGASSFGLVKVSGTVQYLGKTQTLASHDVLLLSSTVKTILIILLVMLLLAIAGIVSRRPKHKKDRGHKPHATS